MAEETLLTIALSVVTDQFKTLKKGNVAGNVYRMLGDEPVPVYDSPAKGSQVMLRLKPGALLVGFSDPGEMRQINTAGQMFGYIKRSVKLVPVAGLDPEGLYDPEKRAAVEAALPPLDEMGSAHAAEQIRTKRNQNYFMIGFVLFVLLGIVTVVMLTSGTPVK
ncbi:MAG: hypothetical protein ACLQU1_19265 [Bryobacteraceae bacterium]